MCMNTNHPQRPKRFATELDGVGIVRGVEFVASENGHLLELGGQSLHLRMVHKKTGHDIEVQVEKVQRRTSVRAQGGGRLSLAPHRLLLDDAERALVRQEHRRNSTDPTSTRSLREHHGGL